MEAISASSPRQWDPELDPLTLARQTIRQEANALMQLADRVGEEVRSAVMTLESCQGSVVVTGMGKAGLVGQKVSATLCSTGTRSYFLHAAEAVHGDLGRVSKLDQVLAFSMSGETEEVVALLPSLKKMADKIISVTRSSDSSLAKQSDVVICLGALQEADANGLAPTTSTTAMMAMGDALALALSQRRGFRETDFVRFHPGGSLGRKLARVESVMRPLSECRVVQQSQTVRESCITVRGPGRRTGAVMVVDEAGKLIGIFTDSDLARLLEVAVQESPASNSQAEATNPLELPVEQVMTKSPRTIELHSLMPAAIELLAENQISELPVVDKLGSPVGLIDITDVISWLPGEHTTSTAGSEVPSVIPFPST